MFKSAILYRLAPDWTPPSLDAFEDALAGERFEPCRATESRSAGWVEPRGREHGALVESIDGQLVASLRIETRAVPASAIKDALDERLQRVEDETGSRPRGKRRKELKEEVVVDLLPRAFSKFSTTRIWIDPAARLMLVGAGSIARADEAVGVLLQCLRAIGNPFAATLLNTAIAPSTGMSIWLSEREAPAGFSIDRECELRQAQPATAAGNDAQSDEGPTAAQQAAENKATVRYSRHDLDIDEIVAHIAQGKIATKLAMTWRDRVSFVLDSSLCLKRIELLDVVIEAAEAQSGQGEDDGFDADVAIMTAELGRLVPDLVDALGGERVAAETFVDDGAGNARGTDARAAEAHAADAHADRSPEAVPAG
ncbi:MAG TPA: recombination-associated protein RdgC [Burkholderiaceae bacterium]|nr:recombination-associated protein RdgC [Burkholderiaceae bacterium]